MVYELRDGQGSLFKNDRKETEKHPDYTGSLKIDGREFWLSAWIKDGAKGKFMSLALKPKDQQGAARAGGGPEPVSSAGRPDMDDSIPF